MIKLSNFTESCVLDGHCQLIIVYFQPQKEFLIYNLVQSDVLWANDDGLGGQERNGLCLFNWQILSFIISK
jgi:hypothetical protein